MKIQNLTIYLCIVASLLLASCSETASSSVSPLATSPNQDFSTPFFLQPSRTPAPFGSEVTPSSTSLPSTGISDFSLVFPDRVEGAEVVWYDDFEFLQSSAINLASFRNADGFVEIKDSLFWRAFQEYHPTLIQEGQGVVLRIKFDAASEARVLFETTTPEDTYLRYGLFAGYETRTDIMQDKLELWGGTRYGEIKVIPDHWYYLLLAIEQDADFLVIIWDSENLEKQLVFEKKKQPGWRNHNWNFDVRGRYGIMYIDEYFEITLDSIE